MDALGLDDPMVSLAAGMYRRSWFRNQRALHRAAAVITSLKGAGIEVLVLKGAALALVHYHDVGARPMDDVDLLVAPGRLDAAVGVLGQGGWHRVASEGAVAGPLQYGKHLRDSEGNELDVHAYALMQSADDQDLWESRVPMEVMGAAASTLAPADQLLHVCVHGQRWEGTSTARWAADAMAILRSSQLDWDRVVERARARRVSVAVGHALSWLREALSAEVPPWVVKSLRVAPRLRFERAFHELYTRPPTRLGWAAMSFDRYRRFALLAPPSEQPTTFISFLQSAWEVDSGPKLIARGARKLTGR
jgi:hypothetical protein